MRGDPLNETRWLNWLTAWRRHVVSLLEVCDFFLLILLSVTWFLHKTPQKAFWLFHYSLWDFFSHSTGENSKINGYMAPECNTRWGSRMAMRHLHACNWCKYVKVMTAAMSHIHTTCSFNHQAESKFRLYGCCWMKSEQSPTLMQQAGNQLQFACGWLRGRHLAKMDNFNLQPKYKLENGLVIASELTFQ